VAPPDAEDTPQADERGAPSSREAARIGLACLDLTSLKGDEDAAAIDTLCSKAAHAAGAPAALCVYPAQVAWARAGLDARQLSAVRVATVVSFPHGDASPDALTAQVQQALDLGADEIDMVLPWRALKAAADGGIVSRHASQPVPLAGLSPASAEAACRAAVQAARRACGARPLKVIIESGELREAALIQQATRIAVQEGADFVKTSTGKAQVHATPEAVEVMLRTISQVAGAQREVGLKVAGGVQTVADVQRYLALVSGAWGSRAWQPQRLRFGASSLWPALVAELTGGAAGASASGAAPNTY
jgi:deoxyribose-phosphate aldolase